MKVDITGLRDIISQIEKHSILQSCFVKNLFKSTEVASVKIFR